MQEPEPQSSQDPHEEIEVLREKLRRLEAEHADVQQRLFDQYEWTREKTKAFDKELRSLRSISLEYKLLDFVRQIYQRTTGLPEKTLEEDVEKLKIFLAAVPTKNDPNTDAWIRSLLRQTHLNFEVVVVIGDSDPEPAQDIKDSANVRIVRTKDEYSDAVRANIGLCFASGDIWGVIAGGYWPYARSIENVARFFAGNKTSQVMLPANLNSFTLGLVAPAEDPHREAFFGLWKSYTGRHGSFFFSPKAYEKIGRINYEASDAWLFGTLLQLAWHFPVGRPNSLVVVNAIAESSPDERAQVESSNAWVRQHFYSLGFFNEYLKPVWYFPVEQSTPKLRHRRLEIEKVFQRLRNLLCQLQRRFYSPDFPLHFPAASDQQARVAKMASIDLSQVPCCPLTERLPDRFLFTLAPLEPGPLADVYYASDSSVAVISHGRALSGGLEEPQSRRASEEAEVQKTGWRFIRPIVLDGADKALPRQPQAGPEGSGRVAGLQASYEAAVKNVLDSEKVTDALWIGDAPFIPSENTTIKYADRRVWAEHPALATANAETLIGSNFMFGRNEETGFDLIHLAGVLQFCHRPRHLLRFLAFVLKFNTPILVSTPNLDSNDLRVLGPAWCHWDPRRSCFIYGAKSLRALMRHCGFEEKILVSFNHSSWRAASRRNLANAIPPADIPAESGFVQGLPASSKSKNQAPAANLEGDFLIGLFNRKL